MATPILLRGTGSQAEWYGDQGAGRVVLYDGAGNPVITADGVPVQQADRTKLKTSATLQLAGADVADNAPVPVKPGTGVAFDVADRAARDLGKVDVAALDQYEPEDVDTGAGTKNALPVSWRKSAAGGPEFGTAADPVRVDPVGTTVQPVGVGALPEAGAHANAWNNEAVGAGGVSAVVDCRYTPHVSAFGHADAATTIIVLVGQDGAQLYETQGQQVLAGAGDFCIHLTTGARYVRLKSSGAATITGTIAAKG